MTKDILANFLPIAACITRTRRTAWRGQSVAPDFARTGTAASAAVPVAANMPSSAAHIEVRRLRVMRARVYPEAALPAGALLVPSCGATGAAVSQLLGFLVYFVVRTELGMRVWRPLPRRALYLSAVLLSLLAAFRLLRPVKQQR